MRGVARSSRMAYPQDYIMPRKQTNPFDPGSGEHQHRAEREHREQRVIQDLIARFEQAQRGGAERLGEFASFIGGPVMEQRGSSRGYNFSIMS